MKFMLNTNIGAKLRFIYKKLRLTQAHVETCIMLHTNIHAKLRLTQAHAESFIMLHINIHTKLRLTQAHAETRIRS
jgi:hypothetical protein